MPVRKMAPAPAASTGMTPRQRVIDFGEVFTPPELVSAMLDLIDDECMRIEARFLEPACGNGNFLAEVLIRKLRTVAKQTGSNRMKWERNAILALCSLYGIDLLPDNVLACRTRLLDVFTRTHVEAFGQALPDDAIRTAEYVLSRNVVQGDALSLRNSAGKPIVFPEWSPINSVLLKRRDFAYAHLLDHAGVASTPLFSDLGENVFLPKPAGDFAPCHYLRIVDQSESSR
jgi:hypothetical protein